MPGEESPFSLAGRSMSAIALTAAIGIQLVILTLKFPLEVFIANPRFEDFDVSAGVCGGSSLPGTG
jgi:hypothetical protein